MEGSALGALGDLPKGFPTRSSRELGKLGRGIGDEYLANQGNRGDQKAAQEKRSGATFGLERPREWCPQRLSDSPNAAIYIINH